MKIKATTGYLSLSSTSLTSGSFYFQEQVIMEPKLEPGPEAVLWLNPIQSGLPTFLSCPSQSGSGSLGRQGKRIEQKSQGWREAPGGWELRLPTHLGLTPSVLPLPFLTKGDNCWNAPSEQKLLVITWLESMKTKRLASNPSSTDNLVQPETWKPLQMLTFRHLVNLSEKQGFQ